MKKAFAWLEGNGIAYNFHDYKKAAVAPEILKRWIKESGWERVLNTKSPTFRQLPSQRQQGLNAAKAVALLQEAPNLIKRPIIEGGKALLIGFDQDAYRAALK